VEKTSGEKGTISKRIQDGVLAVRGEMNNSDPGSRRCAGCKEKI
jgi:hypothetical protein